MSQNFAEIAKEITIAALEKGILIAPGKGSYQNSEEISTYNKLRAEEVGVIYKTIAKAVNDVIAGDFNTNRGQE